MTAVRGSIPQVRRLDDAAALRARLDELGVELPVADRVHADGVLAAPLDHPAARLANRFCILPMEGWDGTPDGRPTDLVRRRWSRFGASGAGLVWGGEAVAVDPAGRANPNQLSIGTHSRHDLDELRGVLVAAHHDATGGAPPPVIGLQLTHSGRWSRPDGHPAPRIAARRPLLDDRVGADDSHLLTDAELDGLVERFVEAAVVAQAAGFDFVDVKHCHGYLLHEVLGAHDRPGPYGGSLDGRTTFLRRVVEGIRRDAPGLDVGVRLSVFDVVPHLAGPDGVGVPASEGSYPFAFGGDGTGLGIDLTETHAFCTTMVELGARLLCVTAGSPYYCPHVQRPAYFPPSDGYQPPNDPLVDVARLQGVTRELTQAHPELLVVGSGLTYLQDHLPNVAQALVEQGWMHSAGLGRMVLSLPELPLQVLGGEALDRRHVCRTFSDCTTAPRHGLVSGCWPLDEEYRARPERVELARIKRAAAADLGVRRGTSTEEAR
jgi:2,4-dienoyl-CoA reductase-like NADH-dependent reductase (Old Yellow Enzyme family)